MSLTHKIYSLGATLTPRPYWPHGKVKAIFMYDFKNHNCHLEYSFLRTLYSDYIDIFNLSKNEDTLSNLEANDKLILIGHAGRGGFLGQHYRGREMQATSQPAYIVTKLHSLGLRNVGVIKFHACFTGNGNFLYDIRASLITSGINFSYLCGPKGNYNYYPFTKRFVSNKWKNIVSIPKIRNQYKIIEGNVSKNFAGTHYQGRDNPSFTIERF
ncbi:hypothetical protein WKW50_25650 [Ochrobactrum sp. GPK 3]|uniref:hypothetical protein n=1 Tax=Brucella sp. 22210 TaxID=3453892 RepID=UPI0031385792